jgi:hypothetical protein
VSAGTQPHAFRHSWNPSLGGTGDAVSLQSSRLSLDGGRSKGKPETVLPLPFPYAIFNRFTLIGSSSNSSEAWLHPQVPNRP